MQYSQALVPLRSEVTGWQICLPGCYRLPDSPQSFHSQLAKKEKKNKEKKTKPHLFCTNLQVGPASLHIWLQAGPARRGSFYH